MSALAGSVLRMHPRNQAKLLWGVCHCALSEPDMSSEHSPNLHHVTFKAPNRDPELSKLGGRFVDSPGLTRPL